MTRPRCWQRYKTHTLLFLSVVALVATSAPETAVLEDTISASYGEGEIASFVYDVNEDGACESQHLQVEVMVTADAATGDPGSEEVLLRVIPDDSRLPVAEQPLEHDGNDWTGSLVLELTSLCSLDAACATALSVEVSPARAYHVEIVGRIENNESGCPIGNPSYSDDANVSVDFLP